MRQGRLVLPVVLVGLATLLRVGLNPWLGDRVPVLFFVLPVVVSALIYGMGSGLIATFLSMVSILVMSKLIGLGSGNVDVSMFLLVAGAVIYAVEAAIGAKRSAKRASEALEESNARIGALFSTAVDGIVVIDERGIIESVNESAVRLFQYSPTEMIGKNVNMLMPEPYRSEHDRYIAHYIETGEKRIIGVGREVVGMRKDGTLFPFDLSVSEVNLHGHRTFTGMVHDVTDRKKVEEERKKILASERAARSEAEHANRMKDEFLATLSHELRTPLNAILGWSQIMQKGDRSEGDLKQGLATIERNARVQAQLIEDLLSMSRITSGKLRLEMQLVKVSTIMEHAMDAVRPAAQARKVQLVLEESAPGARVKGDSARLQQVFWNLLSNAVKFNVAQGTVKIRISRVNENIAIEVSDEGMGIPPRFLPHVFERFRQADSSSTRKFGGLGLGLSIVKELTEAHGGVAAVTSKGEGLGATFTITIPEWRGISVDQEVEATPVESVEIQEEEEVSIQGIRVLVVDDDPDAREIARVALEQAGAIVVEAGSAAEAWNLLQTTQPNVMLCDIGMPNEDGIEFIRRLRGAVSSAGKVASIPAAALTAFARSEDRERSLQAGFQMHIAKPVDPSEIVGSVAALRQFEDSLVH